MRGLVDKDNRPARHRPAASVLKQSHSRVLMAIARFYAGPAPLETGPIELSAAESRHARASRRLKPNDLVTLFDGLGCQAQANIIAIGGDGVTLQIDELQYRDSDAALHLEVAIALPKGPRQDILVEKCTELGVAAIRPIKCARSIAQPSDHRLDKLRRTVIEACKQAQRTWLCDIRGPTSLEDVLHLRSEFDTAYIAAMQGQPVAALKTSPRQKVLILIGPEGGFTDEELLAARRAGFEPVQLAQTILRTETAAITAAACFLTPR